MERALKVFVVFVGFFFFSPDPILQGISSIASLADGHIPSVLTSGKGAFRPS